MQYTGIVFHVIPCYSMLFHVIAYDDDAAADDDVEDDDDDDDDDDEDDDNHEANLRNTSCT